MSLAAGKCNSGIELLEQDGVRLVRRVYGSWVALEKTRFYEDLHALVDAGLVSSRDWLWEDLEDGGVAITNPWVDIVAEPDREPDADVWRAYERALDGLAQYFNAQGLRCSKEKLRSVCGMSGEGRSTGQ